MPIRDSHGLFKRSALVPLTHRLTFRLHPLPIGQHPCNVRFFSLWVSSLLSVFLLHIPGSVTTKGPRPSEPQSCLSPVPAKRSQKPPASSAIDLPSKQRGGDRERSSPQLNTAVGKSYKAASAAGAGTLRKQEKKRDQVKDDGLIQRLQRTVLRQILRSSTGTWSRFVHGELSRACAQCRAQ